MPFRLLYRLTTILLVSLLSVLTMKAQERCATTLLDTHQHSHDFFENWLAKKRSSKNLIRQSNAVLLEIPVVVHIVHNGEPIGTGGNISDAKVMEQIDILNADFRRTNADAGNTPSEFLGVAADTEISFVLARQDPEGLPTSGITRSVGTLSQYRISDDFRLKENIFWPPEDYFNIYVTDIVSFLGYAQFPVANLEGLENEFDPERVTDGVVIDFEYWGINLDTPGSFESFGRTATHEVGHYLGLRHIWGDGGCSFDDFCEDTPQSNDNTSGCPDEKISCGSRDMIENYMDFTNDVCMNIFTVCQADRMRTVLENSPRRRNLSSSIALQEPQSFTNDLGIQEVNFNNGLNSCLDQVIPTLNIRNYGSETTNGFEIALFRNSELVQTIQSNVVLPFLSTAFVAFNPVIPSVGDNDQFEIRIMGSDERAENNLFEFNVFRPEPTPVPHEEDFNVFPETTWSTPGSSLWEIRGAAFESTDDNGFALPYYESNPALFGNLDFLISPIFSLDDPDLNSLSFRYAYAQNVGEFIDGLIVAVSTDCGETFPSQNYIFERYGNALATSPILSQEFNPISSNDWRSVNLDLSRFQGSEIRIAFIGQNGNGNNIFIDDFQVGSSGLVEVDAAIGEVSNFSIASCQGIFNPTIEVINEGTETISDLEVAVITNGTVRGVIPFSNLNIRPGRSNTILIPIDLLEDDLTNIAFDLQSVNNSNDQDDQDNLFSSNVLINFDEDIIPLRENFNDARTFAEVSTNGTTDWRIFTSNGNNALYSDNFNQTTLGKENWLVSPNFELNDLQEGSLTFDVSYRQRENIVDGLRVLLSTNCGLDWSEVIYNRQGALLANVTPSSSEEWFPSQPSDWQTEVIDLTSFITDPFSSQLRIAFVTTNGNGNNIFLDNIQLFQTQEPNLLASTNQMTIFPNPVEEALNISFNLNEKNDILLSIIDVSGRLVRQEEVSNVLNQRFTLETLGLRGVYFVNVRGADVELTERIIIR